ncbi:MAG TPA: carboxypeptidase-like regulatory domain-containing protein, partial [Acidobacteriaceae bacterium]
MRLLKLRQQIFVAASALLLSAGVPVVHAQVVGATLSGTVRDSGGATLSGATVLVRQLETGATRKLTTGADGRYAAPSVPVGDYTVTASHDGFAAQERTGISLTVAQSLAVDFQLSVDSVRTDVVVQAETTSVNITSQQTSGLIDERAVKELPL